MSGAASCLAPGVVLDADTTKTTTEAENLAIARAWHDDAINRRNPAACGTSSAARWCTTPGATRRRAMCDRSAPSRSASSSINASPSEAPASDRPRKKPRPIEVPSRNHLRAAEHACGSMSRSLPRARRTHQAQRAPEGPYGARVRLRSAGCPPHETRGRLPRNVGAGSTGSASQTYRAGRRPGDGSRSPAAPPAPRLSRPSTGSSRP